MNPVPLIAIIVPCLLVGAGSLWYLATQLATLATQLGAIAKHLTDLKEELHETRSSQQDYTAAVAAQVHSQDTRLAVVESALIGRKKNA